jgi:TolB-like protein/tetratricopeptide (TPR) repeat protein
MSFFGEFRRRKIFQVAAVYAVIAWLAVQIVATVEAPLNLPDWADTLVIVLLGIGFPITMTMSWAFNLTPEGLVRDAGGDADAIGAEPGSESTGRRRGGPTIEYVLIGLVVVAVGWLLYRVEFTEPESQAAVAAGQTSQALNPDAATDVLPNSVAVLPFENLSPNPNDAFFAAGVHEEVLNQLAKIHDLTVIARTSVLPYVGSGKSIPEIAGELRVATVMEGSVRYAGERVRVTAQLIDPATGGHLWSEAYEDDIADVFAIQADIATQIAMALEAELLPEERASITQAPTESTVAYEWYLRERSLPSVVLFPAIVPAHLNFLDQAIANDPDFAPPYAVKARIFAEFAASPEDLDLAMQHAERALDLDPSNGTALVAIAMASRRVLHMAEERTAFERAYEVSPSDSEVLIEYARFLSNVGEHAAAAEKAARAAAVDPNGVGVHTRLADVLLEAGDVGGAEAALRRAIELNPSFAVPYVGLAAVAGLAGDRPEGLAQLEMAERFWANGALWILWRMTQAGRLLGAPQTGRLAALLEQRAVAFDDERLGEEPLGYLVFAALAVRNRELALERLRDLIRLIDETDVPMDWSPIVELRSNALRDPLLDEPEFVELRGQLNFRTL